MGGGTVGGKYEDREYSTEVIYSRTLGKTKIRWERNKREDGCQLTPTSGGESWESRRQTRQGNHLSVVRLQ